MSETKHAPAPCYMAGGHELQYSNKNWSDRLVCSVCTNARRFSLNYLGSRRVPMCDGAKISAGPVMDWVDARKLKSQAEYVRGLRRQAAASKPPVQGTGGANG